MIGMAALVRSPDGQFIRCRFHGHILTSLGIAVQCNVVCLSLTSGYAGRHGTSPIALLRDGGGGRKHQSRSTESFSDSARVKPANKGAGRSHRSASARPPFVSRLTAKHFFKKRENC